MRVASVLDAADHHQNKLDSLTHHFLLQQPDHHHELQLRVSSLTGYFTNLFMIALSPYENPYLSREFPAFAYS